MHAGLRGWMAFLCLDGEGKRQVSMIRPSPPPPEKKKTFMFARSTLLGDFRGNARFGDYVAGLLDDGRFLWPREGRGDDSAHPPIHPTKSVDPNSLQGEEKQVGGWVGFRVAKVGAD